ncbi:outer membrane protein assembly factor [Kaistia algarum]|uniref:autotransporter assembly complex protein TamA n=1 Tax=Kaistia algarum TaxID=2083279 RepID=UPI000CE80C7F|nr:autotransporter assembly complex family protein [Kaistia algarum]MCX5512680.1 autotransporter assembly complex protein TamA [Kaistia algarum]PPE81810.1 outer membrane protein assembly factor [Kaistia algarum]
MALVGLAVVALGSQSAFAVEGDSFFDKIGDQFSGLFGRGKTEPVIDAVPYALTIDVVDADRSVRNAVRGASNLLSLRRTPPSGAAGLLRRAASDVDLITAALYGEARYGGTITIRVAGVPVTAPNALAAIEAARAAGPVPVDVTVDPGPLFHFGSIELLDADKHKPLADVPTWRQLGLQTGDAADSSAILAAESRISTFYRDRGYAFAKIVDKDIVADHASRTVDVTYLIATGRPVQFGMVTVTGTEKLKKSFVEERVRIEPGEMFTPQKIAETRKALLKYEAISGVRIIEGEQLDPSGRLPIDIDVTERKPRYVGFGAKYGTTDGAVANVYWGHRNLFGGAETLRLDGQVSYASELPSSVPDADPFGYKFMVSFGKPGILTPKDDLLMQAAVLREVTNAYIREAITFTANVRRTFNDQLSGGIGLDLEASQVQDSSGTNNYNIFGVPIDLAYDTTDNVLDPTRGLRASGTLEPFVYLGDAGAGPVMAKGQFSAYHSLDEDNRYILAGRVAAGSIFGASLTDVPPQRRFYVGGGGTLRGFDYQSQSPKNADGDIIGGLSFVTASAEARIKITDTIGVVPFVDVGTASAAETPDLNQLGVGAGLGLRYYSAVGPLRLDFAVPVSGGEDQRGYGVYLSLGQAF